MHIRSETGVAALGLLSAACAGEVLELGEVSRPWSVEPSRCRQATLVEGSVLVENQAQLDELAGCERIAGDLLVKPFEAPSFAPLASLREVGGALVLGLSEDDTDAIIEAGDIVSGVHLETRDSEIFTSGWLSSLEGFERLESTGSLQLRGTSAPHLEAFSSLRTLTDGAFRLEHCSNLRDLHGLEGVGNVVDLVVACDNLDSLAGLSFPAQMRTVVVSAPALVDLAGFDVEYVDRQLMIQNTALENLDALSNLSEAGMVYIGNNPALTDMDALNGLVYATSLEFESNQRLEHLPEFTRLGSANRLSIRNNAALRTIGSFPKLTPGTTLGAADELVTPSQGRFNASLEVFEVENNPLLETLEVPAGWRAASYVIIDANANLRSVRLSTLTSIDAMIIRRNPLLESIELGALETVDELTVYENPLLPLSVFDSLRTFESQLFSGPIVDE